jgi:PAS domain S-box-containing protein
MATDGVEAVAYLARAGELLERFDPTTSLQAIVDLAVPALADWCFIHLRTAGHPAIAAIAHADPDKLAAARARAATPQPLSDDTAVARVLAGGPPEIVQVDPDVIVRAARDPAHHAQLHRQGYRSAVVAPLVGRAGVLGAVTFTMAGSGRVYEAGDLAMFAELARRTGIALDNARLFAAEREARGHAEEARRHAEEARDRTRRLQDLTAMLSSALDQRRVVSILVDAGRGALGAAAGFAWLLRDPDTLELAGWVFAGPDSRIDGFRVIPMTARLPVCDVVRSAQPMMFESLTAMATPYPDAVPTGESPFRAWAVIPLVVGGRGVGGLSFSFPDERVFSDDDRELLAAMTGQAALALERCILLEAERRARADAEAARQRERRLHELAARLSSALTPSEVAAITCQDVVATLGAYSGGVSIRVGDDVVKLGIAGARDDENLPRVARVPLATPIPSAEAVARSELVWCSGEAELAVRYAHVAGIWRKHGVRAWGAVPFRFEGRTTGSLALSFTEERELGAEDREFLAGVGQLAAQALERARLYEALQTGEEQLRVALTAARAATWRLDLATMTTTRDPVYRALLGQRAEHAIADYDALHPDDRAALQAQFERTLRDGTPFEPEARVRRDDGTYMWVRSHGRVVYGPDARPAMLTGVVVDIDEAKQASLRAEEERRIHKEQLELAIERARLADRRKDEFLAMLGHELRNPLAPITTALELMVLKDASALKKERDVIRRQVEHLSRLIDDLLDVSRITSGKIQLNRQVLQISAVLAKAIEMTSPLLEKRMQRLAIDVPRDGLAVDADPTRLGQVFQNLLTNAAKYSDPGSHIALRARRDADRVVVEVIDHGIGIAPDLLPRLFDLFVQGERALDRAQGGLGIGLAIARSLCELHGGAITAASSGIGAGSTFTVALPIETRAAPLAPGRRGDRPRSAHAMRVLVVDDNVDAAQTLHDFLATLGHEPAIAHDGVAALQLAGSFKPEVAMLDIGLPVMDGYELARKLREQLGPGKLRLIAVTGYGQDSDRARARDAGFDHHLVKPIAFDALMPLLAFGS